MNRFLGPYLDNYTLLEQAGSASEMAGLVERYPWFTLARYMQLRALKIIEPMGYRRAFRQVDARLFAHPYPRILLADEMGEEAVPAFLPPVSETGEANASAFASPQQTDTTIAAIDHFLEQDFSVRIMPANQGVLPEEGYYDQEDISILSVSENGEAVSETLAGIYTAQGRYDKAIGIYYKLSLKYPEKNIYFADLISHVQGLMRGDGY